MASADKYQALLYEPTSSWAHVHKSYFFSTVFQNHRKSLIHNESEASYVYIFSGPNFIKNAKNTLSIFSEFLKILMRHFE